MKQEEYLKININELKTVPIVKKRGIYFLYDDKELVYIGQSIHINTRIYGDHVKGEKRFNSYKYFEVDNDIDLDRIEEYYILEHNPKYNKNSLGNGVYPKDPLNREKRKGHNGKRKRDKSITVTINMN